MVSRQAFMRAFKHYCHLVKYMPGVGAVGPNPVYNFTVMPYPAPFTPGNMSKRAIRSLLVGAIRPCSGLPFRLGVAEIG